MLEFLNSDLVLRWAEVTLGLQRGHLTCKTGARRWGLAQSAPPNITPDPFDPLAHHAALHEAGTRTFRPFVALHKFGSFREEPAVADGSSQQQVLNRT